MTNRRRSSSRHRAEIVHALEKKIIGAAMAHGLEFADATGIERSDFQSEPLKNVFSWLSSNRDKWSPGVGNLEAITSALDAAGMVARFEGGPGYITDLMSGGANVVASALGDTAREFVEHSIDRQIAEIAGRIERGEISPAELPEAVARLEERRAALQGQAKAEPPRFADFAALVAEGFKREMPTLCEYAEGRFLLYAGRLNEIHGEPSVGKTNIALCIAAEVMHDGGRVLYLDPEDNPQGIGARFLALGGRPEDLLERFFYVHNPEPGEFAALQAWAREHKPALVFLDGLAEALAAEGLSEDVSGDILQFFRSRLRPFADAGAGVLISDHVVKDKETRGRWARGSGAKLGRYDGAVYEAKLIKAYSPEMAGSVRLIVSKDRNGGVGPLKSEIVDLHFDRDAEGNPDIRFEAPSNEQRKQWQPSGLMQKISRYIEDHGEQTKSALRGLGNHTYVDQAISRLIELGHMSVENRGAARLHKIVNPYRETAAGEAAA